MSFQAFEESTEGGQPIELYEFGYQGGTFRYTSTAETFSLLGIDYVPVPGLTRSDIEDTGDIAKSSLTLTAPEDFAISKLFEVYPPSDVVDLKVLRVHYGDQLDARTIWLGRVLNVVWQVGASELTCESVFTRLKQPGLRRAYGRNCPHLLYGPDCRAVAASFRQTAVLYGLVLNGFGLQSAVFDAAPDGYFSGGKIEFDLGGGLIERRGIRSHVGDTIRISHPIVGLTANSTVQAYPGCDRTRQTCNDKFANGANHGGFPYMVVKNPFTQSVY